MPRQPERQNEILELIAKYGVMSTRTLWKITDQKITYASIRRALNELERRGLVVRPTGLMAGHPVHYWMLSRESEALERTSLITGYSVAELKQKKMRYTHFPHEDLCTLLQVSLERFDSRFKILRGKDTRYVDLPDHLLTERIQENGFCPDLCIGVPFFEDTNTKAVKGYR